MDNLAPLTTYKKRDVTWAQSALSYAKLSVVQFEEKRICLYIKGMFLFYFRYTDNIFFIWKGTKEQLTTFINNMNEKHKTINRFKYKILLQKIPFLDTTVQKDKENNLQATL